ncbi:3-hydroxyacyl-ACP dehydratase [Photobacterium aquae]|uniref:ApeI family dehydratase n=1 Tax=Photobacterium aquae TaxID=1195763 RepID=UPI0012ED7C5D|nr:3-hydroxyacyl-ACP dehydratase [Photobacterium aquae]
MITTKRKPTILRQEVDENHAVLSLMVDADIVDFKGHFTSYPLLPGVTQIHWAVEFGIALLDIPAQFGGMEVIKFQAPILPGVEIELELEWNVEKEKLHFCYRSVDSDGEQTAVHSLGRIKLDMAQ